MFSVLSRLLTRNLRQINRSQTHRNFQPSLETLDDRWVPTTLHVGSLAGQIASIQQAIDEAVPGDIIAVSPGTYQEQLTIDTNTSGTVLNKLTIEAVGSAQNTIIEMPASASSSTAAIVEITSAQNVTIRGLTIEGLVSSSGSVGFGIEVDGGGNAKIIDNHITQIEDNPVDGAQNGVAIQVGDDSTSQTGSATITDNTIDDYQKNGIVVSNTGSTATITGNTVIGLGPTTVIAENGIEVSYGASGKVLSNTVSGNIYTPTSNVSTGILLYQPGIVHVSANTVTGNDVGIYAYEATGAHIVGNTVKENVFDGIELDTTSQATVEDNVANKNGSNTHDVQGGDVDGGIALFASSGNTVSGNTTNRNNGDGIYADSASTGNVFTNDVAEYNTTFDAEDESVGTGTKGSANTWTSDTFITKSI